jgi:hypothetical protein
VVVTGGLLSSPGLPRHQVQTNLPTPSADSKSSGANAERPLGIGECLGLVTLILLPGIGLVGLVILSVTHLRPHLWGVARAALLWHVLLWSALVTAVLYFAVRLGVLIWEVLSHLGPVP